METAQGGNGSADCPKLALRYDGGQPFAVPCPTARAVRKRSLPRDTSYRHSTPRCGETGAWFQLSAAKWRNCRTRRTQNLPGSIDGRNCSFMQWRIGVPLRSGLGGAGGDWAIGPGAERLAHNDTPHSYHMRNRCFGEQKEQLPSDVHFLQSIPLTVLARSTPTLALREVVCTVHET